MTENHKTPILFVGDSPSAQTGLARILRDLALRLHLSCSDIFDVATFGYGGHGDKNLPFPQYMIEGMENWFLPTIEDVWDNFAGDRKGIIFFIWDPSRLLWFARPDIPGACDDQRMQAFLQSGRFQKWIYAPMDAVGPNQRLSVIIRECLKGFDQVIAYSRWEEKTIRASVEPAMADSMELTALPHGIDTRVFRPQHPIKSRESFTRIKFRGPEIQPHEKIIGIVATNQTRKDWGLAYEALSQVAKSHPIRVFVQTDILERKWSFPALIHDYNMVYQTIINCNLVPDEEMTYLYSACDVTLGIGLGEGFGYPIFESLACGTPCITGNYGGQAEWLSDTMVPIAYRLEGLYNCVRPVYDASKWAYRISKMLREGKTGESLLPPALAWENLWPRWEIWFRDGRNRLIAQDESLDRHDSKSERGKAKPGQSRLKAVSKEARTQSPAAAIGTSPDLVLIEPVTPSEQER
jgi:glycosyltransferase involved in cell wall biosynthesis